MMGTGKPNTFYTNKGDYPDEKWVSLILSTALVSSLVAGCGSNETSDGNVDAAGETKPLKFSISLNTSGNAYTESSKDINTDKWVKELEKRANVDLDIKLIPLKDFDSKMAVMFAGGDIPDVVQNVGGATDNRWRGRFRLVFLCRWMIC